MSDFSIPFGREQDRGYRRGFDQGIYETLTMLGLDDDTLQDLAWKKKIAKWRHSSPGKTFMSNLPPQPDDKETEQARAAIKRRLA